MTDRIIARINDQTTACTLLALRSHLIEAGRWNDAIHGLAYRIKFAALSRRWRKS